MSEHTDKMIKEAGDVFLERFKGPVYIYMFTAIVLFNWDNILIILLSSKDIEARIALVYVTWDSWLNFWRPIVLGCIASISMPFLSLFVYFVTSFAVHGVNKTNELTGGILEQLSKWRQNKLKQVEDEINQSEEKLDALAKQLDLTKESVSSGQAQIKNLHDEIVRLIARVVFMAGYLETHDQDPKSLDNLVKRHKILYNNNENEADLAYELVKKILEDRDLKGMIDEEVRKSLILIPDEKHVERLVNWLKNPS